MGLVACFVSQRHERVLDPAVRAIPRSVRDAEARDSRGYAGSYEQLVPCDFVPIAASGHFFRMHDLSRVVNRCTE